MVSENFLQGKNRLLQDALQRQEFTEGQALEMVNRLTTGEIPLRMVDLQKG